jgi:cyanophycinase
LIDGVISTLILYNEAELVGFFKLWVILLGIGLGEDTGLLITHNTQMEAIGSGLVILVDGREIKDTNLTKVELGQPISISHLVTHVMSKLILQSRNA